MVKTGQAWSGVFVTLDATGALATPSVGPAGALYVDGTANAASVTISGSNPYKWTVTLPALTAGQTVSMYITATIAAIATASVVAEDIADTVHLSDVNTAVAGVPTAAGVADAVWNETLADHIAAGSTGKALTDILEDTSTTLPAQIAVAASVIANSTDATAAGAITRKRGNSWSIALTLGAITGYTSLWFTVKRSTSDTDSDSVVQIKLNATGLSDGLLTVNGATATNDALGSITVSDASTGAIIIALDETVTVNIAPGAYYYDAQALISGDVSTPDSGTLTVTADVTRSVA